METEKWALLWVHLPNRFLYPYYSLVNMPTQITKEPSITGACIWPTPSGVNSCFTLETSPYVSPRRDKKEIRKVIRRKEEEENADELISKFSEFKFWDMCRRQCGWLPFISKEQWCEGCLIWRSLLQIGPPASTGFFFLSWSSFVKLLDHAVKCSLVNPKEEF